MTDGIDDHQRCIKQRGIETRSLASPLTELRLGKNQLLTSRGLSQIIARATQPSIRGDPKIEQFEGKVDYDPLNKRYDIDLPAVKIDARVSLSGRWIIGFILNVARVKITWRYSDQKRPTDKSWKKSLLDTSGKPFPFIPVSRKEGSFKPNQPIEVGFQDFPGGYSIVHYLSDRAKLRKFHHTIQFNLWLAAKNKDIKQTELVLLASWRWKTIVRIVVESDPIPRGQPTGKVDKHGKPLLAADIQWPNFKSRAYIADFKEHTPGVGQPVTTGPIANTELNSWISKFKPNPIVKKG